MARKKKEDTEVTPKEYACVGMPFGLVGMGIGFLFSFLWNKFIAE